MCCLACCLWLWPAQLARAQYALPTWAYHSPVSVQVPYEVRAAWLTTLSGLDWPRRPARNADEAAQQQRELLQILDHKEPYLYLD